MNEKGIIASGTVKTKHIVNDYSLVECYNKEHTKTAYEIRDEWFVSVDYDKKCIEKSDDSDIYTINENATVKASEFRGNISNKLFNRTSSILAKYSL